MQISSQTQHFKDITILLRSPIDNTAKSKAQSPKLIDLLK